MALVVWALALAAAIATSTSLTITSVAGLARPLAARVHPRARARLWLLAALAPAFATILLMSAVLAPSWFGGIDHCEFHADQHLHLCVHHGAPWPPVAVSVVAVLWLARVLGLVGQDIVGLARARTALRQLGGAGAEARLALPGAIAFTAGWLCPRVYASAPVFDDPRWSAVIAHERDHVRHRDPLARAIARLALNLHAPFVAERIERNLVAAQELAADEAAAVALGDRLAVAEQLVTWARELRTASRVRITALGASAFEEGVLEERVRALAETPSYVRAPLATAVIGASVMAAVLVAVLAPYVHHGVETLLGALGA